MLFTIQVEREQPPHSSSSGAPDIVSGIRLNETNAGGFIVLLR